MAFTVKFRRLSGCKTVKYRAVPTLNFTVMRKIFTILAVAMLAVSCHQEYDIPMPQKERDVLPAPTRLELNPSRFLNDSLMVLGLQLENPYALDVMQEARAQLLEENPGMSIPAITAPSHYYVRFAPANDDELYTLLQDTTVHFFDFPLDREVVSGVYYHDPAIADSLPTYQYASIPVEKWLRDYSDSAISHEILEDLFIPEDEEEFFGGGGDDDGDGNWWDNGNITPNIPGNPWIPSLPGDEEINPNTVTLSAEDIIDMLVDKAMYLTGNLDSDSDTSTQSVAGTNSSSSRWTPSGRITAYDDIANAQIPLEGVKVWAQRWFTIREGYTDANGNFTCNGTLRGKANYYIKWERAYWDIREGYTGQAYYNEPSKISGEWNLSITSTTPKSLAYSAIHRAMYRIYYKDNEGLRRPNLDKKLKIAYLHDVGEDAYGENYDISGSIRPKVIIYGFGLDNATNQKNARFVSEVLCTVFHEVAGHIAHSSYSDIYLTLERRYREAWALCAQYYFLLSEYRELGVVTNLNIWTPEKEASDDNFYVPDNTYNYQVWNKEDSEYNSDYPPIFIDILDEYNQYKEIKKVLPNAAYKYPDDRMCFDRVWAIEQAVYESSNFSQIREKFKVFCNPNFPLIYFEEDCLNDLFDYYEN